MKKVLLLLVVFNFQFSILNFIHAGGMMSNTNQNAAFIRNPARDGAIGIDGVYSNPAGVALMPEGWHMSLNWQLAWQRRIVDTQNPVFMRDANNGGKDSKHYRGIATAPFLPSVQLLTTGRSSLSRHQEPFQAVAVSVPSTMVWVHSMQP